MGNVLIKSFLRELLGIREPEGMPKAETIGSPHEKGQRGNPTSEAEKGNPRFVEGERALAWQRRRVLFDESIDQYQIERDRMRYREPHWKKLFGKGEE